jgi:hypothetical protein
MQTDSVLAPSLCDPAARAFILSFGGVGLWGFRAAWVSCRLVGRVRLRNRRVRMAPGHLLMQSQAVAVWARPMRWCCRLVCCDGSPWRAAGVVEGEGAG